MLAFIFKTLTLGGKEEAHLSKDKALQPRKPFGKQLKTIHGVLAAKLYRGQCFRLGKLWQKATWPLAAAVRLMLLCCGMQVSSRVALLQLVATRWTCWKACLPAKSAHVHLQPALAALLYLPESCQQAKPFALKMSCVSPKNSSPPRPCLPPSLTLH